jgi:hypothetical protein
MNGPVEGFPRTKKAMVSITSMRTRAKAIYPPVSIMAPRCPTASGFLWVIPLRAASALEGPFLQHITLVRPLPFRAFPE